MFDNKVSILFDTQPLFGFSCEQDLKKNQSQSLPVLMPGDQIPKFIALPCPCEPPRPYKVEVKVQKPPKPPRFPVPLY